MKPKTIKLIINIIAWTLIILSLGFITYFYIGISKVSSDTALEASPVVDNTLLWTYILAALGVLIAFVLVPIYIAIIKPKTLVKFGISLIMLIIIVLISYAISSGQGVNYGNVSEKTVLIVDTGLHTLYILSIIGLLAIIFAEIKNMLK